MKLSGKQALSYTTFKGAAALKRSMYTSWKTEYFEISKLPDRTVNKHSLIYHSVGDYTTKMIIWFIMNSGAVWE